MLETTLPGMLFTTQKPITILVGNLTIFGYVTDKLGASSLSSTTVQVTSGVLTDSELNATINAISVNTIALSILTTIGCYCSGRRINGC
jgi:hypothetical protein